MAGVKEYDYVSSVIAAAGTDSAATAQIRGKVVALIVPTATSATLKFQGSIDGTNFYDIYDDATTPAQTTITIAAGTHNKAYSSKKDGTSLVNFLQGFKYLKVIAGAGQTNGLTVTFIVERELNVRSV